MSDQSTQVLGEVDLRRHSCRDALDDLLDQAIGLLLAGTVAVVDFPMSSDGTRIIVTANFGGPCYD